MAQPKHRTGIRWREEVDLDEGLLGGFPRRRFTEIEVEPRLPRMGIEVAVPGRFRAAVNGDLAEQELVRVAMPVEIEDGIGLHVTADTHSRIGAEDRKGTGEVIGDQILARQDQRGLIGGKYGVGGNGHFRCASFLRLACQGSFETLFQRIELGKPLLQLFSLALDRSALTRNLFLQSVQFGICALRHDRRGQTQQGGRYDY